MPSDHGLVLDHERPPLVVTSTTAFAVQSVEVARQATCPELAASSRDGAPASRSGGFFEGDGLVDGVGVVEGLVDGVGEAVLSVGVVAELAGHAWGRRRHRGRRYRSANRVSQRKGAEEDQVEHDKSPDCQLRSVSHEEIGHVADYNDVRVDRR